MKVFKFILKCILAVLPLMAVIMFTAFVPYGYMDIEYPSWKYTKDVCKGKACSDATTLILGDSRAMADLIPEMISDNTYNLAVGGATAIEMYYTLNEYIGNNGVPENVIIMFAPFHYTIIDNFNTRTAYFNYLSVNDMRDLISYGKAAESETLTQSGYIDSLISCRLRFPDKYLPALINARAITRYDINKAEYIKISTDRGYGAFGTDDGSSDLNYETGYEHMHTTGDAVLLDIYVNRLLQLCEDNGINTVLAIPPMNTASYEMLNDTYTAEFADYINTLKINHPAIYIDGEIPCYDNSLFGDSSHLNRKGAEIFTADFLSQLSSHSF